MARTTSAVTRKVVGGSTLARPGADLRAQQMSGNQPLLQRAVVIEVYEDPGSLTDEQKQEIEGQVNNPELVDILPGNSVLARVISDNQDAGSATSTVLFPFFSSFIQFPIVPGEQVWVIYPDPERNGTVVGYWLYRVSEQRTVEDVNFSVHDRRFFPEYNPQNLSTTERGRDGQHVPSFPNGADTTQTYTLRTTGSNGENPYDGILEGSSAMRNFTFEPIPRYKKRPGETVIQGKNNSLIVFGEDRTGPVVRADADVSTGRAGSVDIVAGRGRKLPATESDEPEETAPRLIKNTRDKLEVNKTPYLQEGKQDNIREGDPDQTNDAARIFISMQSEADVNFKLTDISFPENTLEFEQPSEGSESVFGKSYVVAKADNLRFIARKSDDVDGTILIIREGVDENDIAYIHIDKDGKFQIYSKEIFLGKSTGKEEPYIKWTEFKKTVQKLQGQIDDLKTFCDNLTTTVQTAFTAAVAVPFNPISGLTAQVPMLISHKATLGANLPSKKQEASQAVEDAKSEVIFGE
jgi:hypothetical protein